MGFCDKGRFFKHEHLPTGLCWPSEYCAITDLAESFLADRGSAAMVIVYHGYQYIVKLKCLTDPLVWLYIICDLTPK